jgi:hypothetical protein
MNRGGGIETNLGVHDRQMPTSTRRREYQPPAVEESGVFETLILQCGTAEMAGEPGCGNPSPQS